jgi:hypothetical protein
MWTTFRYDGFVMLIPSVPMVAGDSRALLRHFAFSTLDPAKAILFFILGN